MLRANADKDPYLRHAGVMGLVGSGRRAAWKQAAHDQSPAVRMGVLLALRRLGDPEIARFLNDPDPRLVLEAARAINDVPIASGAAPPRRGSAHCRARRCRCCGGSSTPTSGWAGPSTPRVLAGGRRSVRPARIGARPGPGDAGRLGQTFGPRPRHGALAADPATFAAAGGRWPCGPSSPRSWLRRRRLVRTAAVVATGGPGHQGRRRHAGHAGRRSRTDRRRPAPRPSRPSTNWTIPRRVEAAQQALLLPGSSSRTEALRLLAKVDPAAAIAPLARPARAWRGGRAARGHRHPGRHARRRGPTRALRLARPADRRQGPRRDPARPDRGRRGDEPRPSSAASSSSTNRPSPRTTRWPRIAKSLPAATPSAA